MYFGANKSQEKLEHNKNIFLTTAKNDPLVVLH